MSLQRVREYRDINKERSIALFIPFETITTDVQDLSSSTP